MRPVYLDNNATTRTDPAVLAAMLPFFTEHFGNASSPHLFGAAAADALREARGQVRALLGAAHDQEIIFTSGGTESDNAALLSALETQSGRDEIVTTAVEHPAILALAGHLAKTRGVTVHRIPVDGLGRLDEDAFAKALGPRTAIASVMWANNETGTLFPVERLARRAHEAGALFHTDGVQAVGRIPLDLGNSEIDMLSLSGHKLHGPKGIGALFLRKGIAFRPLLRGGQQERGRRGGTENLPAIVGLGKAASLALAGLDAEGKRLAVLRDRLETGLVALIGDCLVNGDKANRLPNTTNLAFHHLDGEAILIQMSRAGLAASSGAACSSGSTEPSHVLRAMKIPSSALQGVVRLSLSRDSTAADVDRVLAEMPGIIGRLREMSPHWRNQTHPGGAVAAHIDP